MKKASLWICLLLTLLCMAFALTAGSADISIREIINILFGEGETGTNPSSFIIWQIRLPRIILSMLTGSALAVCGAAYQAIFRNPLSEPYILGVSSGASLGAALAIVLGFESFLFGISGMAFVFSLLTVFFIYRIASTGNRMQTNTLLLSGVSFNFLIAAIISFLVILNKDKMDKIIFWTMGSMASATWSQVQILLPCVIIGISIIYIFAKDMNVLLLGTNAAQNLGVEVEKVKKIILFFSTLMVAVAVSYSGVIGFVGFVVPHLVRLRIGSDNRKVIPYSMFGGAVFVLLADTFARTVLSGGELPVGSITALVGAPFFLFLLYKAKLK